MRGKSKRVLILEAQVKSLELKVQFEKEMGAKIYFSAHEILWLKKLCLLGEQDIISYYIPEDSDKYDVTTDLIEDQLRTNKTIYKKLNFEL